MRIAIYGREVKQEFVPKIELLLQDLSRRKASFYMHRGFYTSLSLLSRYPHGHVGLFSGYHDLPKDLDLMICIGGDGAFLETVGVVRDSGIPLIGINSGRLGFLTNISGEEILEAVDALFGGRYSFDERTLLRVDTLGDVFGDYKFAFNDVTIQKKDATLITIHTWMDDEFLNSYWSDGLIISTPSGSTAYSLSVGGPIVMPQSRSIIISPIAPHNLSVRPIIIPDSAVLKCRIESRRPNFIATVDSRAIVCDSSQEFTIRLADFKVRLVRLNQLNFFTTLRNKLMWGVDSRN
jgi:NAD+ kinase